MVEIANRLELPGQEEINLLLSTQNEIQEHEL
jgi:hypothetical protein